MRASVLFLSLCVALPAGIAQTPADRATSTPGIAPATDRFFSEATKAPPPGEEGGVRRFRQITQAAAATPVITGLSASTVNIGLPYVVDVKGTGFISTSQVMLSGQPAAMKFVSATDLQIAGTATAPPGAAIAVTVVNPGAATSSNAMLLTVAAAVSVQLVPGYTMTIRCGTQLIVTAQVLNNSNQAVTWQANGITGGNATVGTISGGVYLAPLAIPTTPSVTISAISAADPTASANLTVDLENAPPAIASVNPNPVSPTATSVTINGTGFAPGAVVYFAESALPTTFVSSTTLTVAGPIAPPPGNIGSVKVVNPNPGSLTSPMITVPMQLTKPLMSYGDAVRFLQMATFGPTPASIVELQTMGRDAWLAAQFAKPASAWPDPYNDAEGITRLQSAFFNIAVNGDDQLRQRVSFALAQILVVSAVKDTEFTQMVTYQRLLGDNAFGNFSDLLRNMTLSPAMGYYLDMVNNAKANPATGTAANENYAREILQLFTVGLAQLNADGTSNGGVEYGQDTISNMAKALTGWTYAAAPGYETEWTNAAYYFAPMVAFDVEHDTTQKNLNLPIPCVIAPGGTASGDLDAALACILKQQNVAPFISYRLIQRLVMSNPSPAYVSRVAGVFTASGGNLQSVVTAILTDSEASTPGSGKLIEPVLYSTGLLRALNATVADGSGLAAQTTTMGQNPLDSPTVFNFFSPFYTLPGSNQVAPEFQALNAATALARANFAYRAVTNGIASTVTVNLNNWLDLASIDNNQLVAAVNQALFRGQMDNNMQSVLLTAAQNSTTAATRVRSVLYAAAASPQYQVQQ